MDLVADRCGGSCGELEIWDRHVVDLVADRCGGSCGKRTKAPHRARLPSLKIKTVHLLLQRSTCQDDHFLQT